MGFTFVEIEGRKLTLNPPTGERKFLAAGETSDLLVYSYALGLTPASLLTPAGLIYRQDLKLEEDGFARYIITVPYARNNQDTGQFTWNFDTTGATVNIKASKEHIHTYAASGITIGSNPHAGAIEVGPDGEAKGADIVIPCLKINLQFQHPSGSLNLAKVKAIAGMTGKTNSSAFLGGQFNANEMLFLGAQGSDGTNAPSSVTYQFACSSNATGLTVGSISGIAKKGWELAWVEFYPGVDGDGNPTTKPKAIHIERVYEAVDFASILGFGG